MTTNNFYYGLSLLETLYGITLPEEDYEEIALVAWGLIGNKRIKTYRYSVCMDSCKNFIELPCNCDILEAVTTGFEDFENVNNNMPNGDFDSAAIEHYIEHRKSFHDPLYINGKFVKYERVGNTLYFNQPYNRINILYKGVQLDNNGLPEITDKEARAIATYTAYVTKYKEGLSTNNASIINLAEQLRSKWLVQCDQARVPEYLNQNEMDQILDAKTNWNRKIHSKSYKPNR